MVLVLKNYISEVVICTTQTEDGLNPGSIFSQTTEVQRGQRAQIKGFKISLMSIMDKLEWFVFEFCKASSLRFWFCKNKNNLRLVWMSFHFV